MWQALFDLTQGFLLCYQAFEREISQHPQNNKWQALLPQLIARQIIHQGLDAKIRLYRYEQWIPARWSDLHSLFQMACTLQIERQPVAVLAGGVLTTIEQEYLRVLLLQLMNAGNLSPRHVEWVAEQLSEWCAPLRLNIESSTVTSFYVDLGSRTGLKRRGPEPLEGRVLFLDTRPLHAVLMQNVVMLEQKVRNDPLSDRAPRRAEQLNLLTKLAAQVDPEFRPVAEAGERTNARERRRDRRLRQDLRLSARRRDASAGRERRAPEVSAIRSRSRPSAACATRMRARSKSSGAGSRPTRRRAVRGRSATYRRPATGWSRR